LAFLLVDFIDFSDLYAEANLDEVMKQLDSRLNGTLRGTDCQISDSESCDSDRPFFRAVVPFRSMNWEGSTPEKPVPLGFATNLGVPRLILKAGGVCEGRYGLQIFLFP
jgi:hypothetical protein